MIFLKLSTNICIVIRSQQLVFYSLDGDILVDDPAIFSRMDQAMQVFKHRLLNPAHMSNYSGLDLERLDQYRTVVPTGRMHDITPAIICEDGFVDIDIHKAFAHAAAQIKCVRVLNVFDVFFC